MIRQLLKPFPLAMAVLLAAALTLAGATLGLLGATVLVITASAGLAAARAPAADWAGFWRWWRLQTRPLGRGTAIASLNAMWSPLRRVLRPDYLFVIYPGTEEHKRLYFPPWVERTLRPVFPCGALRFGRFWGLIVSGLASAETLESSPDRLKVMLDEAREQFPGVEVIALGGRLPGIAEKTGVGLERPFIHGDRGTVCAMAGAARELAAHLGRDPAGVTLALAGGGGFIGSRLVGSLAKEFEHVIALDPRFEGTAETTADGVTYTNRPQDLADAEAVLLLTARGTDTAEMVPHMAPGTVVADDTHPEMPASLRAAMEERGVTVLKATVADDRIRIVPRIPIYRSDDIPGCLLEALVVVQRGSEVLESQERFDEAAAELGFQARLAPHLKAA